MITLEPFPMFSKNFRRFPNISEDFRRFSENFENHKNIWKLLLNRFRSFPKISDYFRTLPKISEDFLKILKNHRSLFGAHIIKRTLHRFQKIWILSSRGQNISLVSLRSTREIFLPLEDKIRIFWKPCNILCTQGPHSQILMTGGWGMGVVQQRSEVHILYPKKSQLQNLSTQKNHYFF